MDVRRYTSLDNGTILSCSPPGPKDSFQRACVRRAAPPPTPRSGSRSCRWTSSAAWRRCGAGTRHGCRTTRTTRRRGGPGWLCPARRADRLPPSRRGNTFPPLPFAAAVWHLGQDPLVLTALLLCYLFPAVHLHTERLPGSLGNFSAALCREAP